MTDTSAGAWSRRWAASQGWRRSRPFWSGLLLILAGIELFLSANMDLGDLQVHLGYEGFLSYVIPMIMVLVGVFVWVTPNQRAFYSIVATATAVYSLIGLNLGGWFLGMLLGIVGGALGFAWTPRSPAPGGTETHAEASPAATDETITSGFAQAPDVAGQVSEPPTTRGTGPRQPGRHTRGSGTTLVLLPLLLVAVGVVAAPKPAHASSCTATPTPTASATPTWQPGDLLRALWELIFPKPTPTCPSPSPSQGPSPSGSTDPSGTASPSANPSPTGRPAPSTSASPGPTPSALPPTVAQVGAGQPVVAATPGKMTTSTLTLEGFGYEGVATLPTSQGTVRALKFTISKATNANFTLLVSGGGRTLSIKSNPLVVRGHVLFYTSKFSGKLLGIPLTFTPDSPPPLTLPLMVFTDVTVDLVFLDCDVLEAPTLDQVWTT